MSIVTNYDRWKSEYLPKLKAKLSPGDKAENSYRTNAIGIQVNGSTVTLGLLNHLDKLITIPVFRDDNQAQPATDEEREKALESVFKMVADVVKAQKNSDTTVPVSIDISASGFSISKHPEFFTSKGLTPVTHPNVHYLENYTVSQQPSGLNFPEGEYKKPSFINFRQRLEKELGNTVGMKITYLDESGISSVTQGQKSFSFNMTTMNDTNTLAFQLEDQLNQGDTVIGVVGGTGFNVGVNKSYDGKGSFDSISNLECGGTVLPEQDLLPFLSPIDRFKLQAEPNTPPEWFFAGGQEDQGLVNIAKKIQVDFRADLEKTNDNTKKHTIYDRLNGYPFAKAKSRITNFALEYLCYLKNDKKFDLKPGSQSPSWLTGSEPLTNEFIMNKAKDNEPLALAMVNDFASRWGGFIKNRLDAKGLLNGVNNPKYAITGSHLQHLLRIPSAKTAFAKALSVPEANLINIKKGEMDGMQAILKAKIATARAAV